jgi:hypothetical protein
MHRPWMFRPAVYDRIAGAAASRFAETKPTVRLQMKCRVL